MTHPGGLSTYHCEGGRSFTVDTMSTLLGHGQPAGSSVSRPSAWYIAVSNCAALNGLDLRYRLVVYGHVGDCPSPDDLSPSSVAGQSVSSSLLVQHDLPSSGRATVNDDGTTSCLLKGSINTTSPWHGFIANMSLARGGGFRFRFRFVTSTLHTSSPSALRVLLYRQEDVNKLSSEQMCWQKNSVIRQRHERDQVSSAYNPRFIAFVYCVPQFYIGGQRVGLASEYVHLGHIVSASLDDKNDVLAKRNSLCGKINSVLYYLWKRDPLVKLKLLRSYCSDFYDSVLWDMTHLAIENVCVTWRKGLQRVWDLPAATYSRFVTSLCGLPQLKVELACRCGKFIVNCLNSSNSVVKHVAIGRGFTSKDYIPQLVGTHTIVSPRLMLLFLA